LHIRHLLNIFQLYELLGKSLEHNTKYRSMDDPQLSRSATSYTARLDRTLKLLQDRVKEQEAALEKVRIGR
jgi:hypothetical protein